MKSERRHELATNELADWIANFPQWLKDNKTTVIVGSIVVVGLIAYTIFFYNMQGRTGQENNAQASAMIEQLNWQKNTVLQGKAEGLGVSDLFLSTAGSLATVAAESENKNFSALATIKRAEALRSELHYRAGVAEKDYQASQLGQAKKLYEEALTKTDIPTIAAMAEYGIGLCLEDAGDFDGAKTIYQKIADANQYQGTSFAERAKQRIETFDDYKSNFVFAKAAVQPQQLSLEVPLAESNTVAIPGADVDFNSAVK
jgi:tetratricopeptide (TPR) repeat protein